MMNRFWGAPGRQVWLLAVLLLTITMMAGCGGGGGGGSTSPITPTPTTPNPTGSTVSVAGILRDQPTGNVLPNRTVTLTTASGTTYTGNSDSGGIFVIPDVPLTTVTVTIIDSNNVPQVTPFTADVSRLSGNPRVLAYNDSTNTFINLNLSTTLPGGPPI